MEQDTKSQSFEEKHYGRTASIIIVGVLAVIGIVYGVFFGVQPKKETYVANNKKEGVVATTTAHVPPPPPVEVFVMTDANTKQASAPIKAVSTTELQEMKSPVNFKSFSYDASVGKVVSISGTCHDAYYAFLVFESKDDYRKEPGKAYTNRAFECPASRLFTIKMDLREINLSSGTYYLFVADQGKTGSWYNPR